MIYRGTLCLSGPYSICCLSLSMRSITVHNAVPVLSRLEPKLTNILGIQVVESLSFAGEESGAGMDALDRIVHLNGLGVPPTMRLPGEKRGVGSVDDVRGMLRASAGEESAAALDFVVESGDVFALFLYREDFFGPGIGVSYGGSRVVAVAH